MEDKGIKKLVLAALVKVLKPLVRILIRNGVSCATCEDLVRWVFVDVARREFGIPNRKTSLSRISVVTGLPRKEVARLMLVPAPEDREATRGYNRAARVMSGWVRDVDFADAEGRPAALELEGERGFAGLVRRHGGDIPPKAVLDELLRVDCVEMRKDGRVSLRLHEYVPAGSDGRVINILGTDVADLVATIDHNMTAPPADSRVQLKVCYDNLPAHVLPRLRLLSREKTRQFMDEMDRWLAGHDRDGNPAVEGSGRTRAGIGIWYFEEPYRDGEAGR